MRFLRRRLPAFSLCGGRTICRIPRPSNGQAAVTTRGPQRRRGSAAAGCYGRRRVVCRGGPISSISPLLRRLSGPFIEGRRSPMARQPEVRVLAGSITAKRSATANYRTRDSPANPTCPVTCRGRGCREVAGGSRPTSLSSRLHALRAFPMGRAICGTATAAISPSGRSSSRGPCGRGTAVLTARGSFRVVRPSNALASGVTAGSR